MIAEAWNSERAIATLTFVQVKTIALDNKLMSLQTMQL